MALSGDRPIWVTFDCYGTLIQWDEGLLAAVTGLLQSRGAGVDPGRFLAIYDRHEHGLEQSVPHRSFRDVTSEALGQTMAELGLASEPGDAERLTASIGRMPPFPEVVPALAALKRAGFSLAIISNTDDAIIAGNVAQLGGHIDRVITAEQAGAYKPSARIFGHAHKALGVTRDQVVHVCASPHLDLVAARDLSFRAVWIDRGTGRRAPEDYAPAAVLPSLEGVPALFAAAGWI
jgi:2-haloalkanoic acid dehalogenase type II